MMRFLIAFVGVVYCLIGIGYAIQRKWNNAGVWICYGLANYFLYQLDGAE